MKRYFSLITVLIVLFISIFVLSISCSAQSGSTGDCSWSIEEAGDWNRGGYILTIKGNGAMSPTAPNEWKNFTITKVVIKGGVTSIEPTAFYGLDSIYEVTIAESVTRIGGEFFPGIFTDSFCLENIFVDANNPCFTSVDGVLFNKDKTALLRYPGLKDETSYVIPETVTEICVGAFAFAGISQVEIPESVKKIGFDAFSDSHIANDASNWDTDGVLYIDGCLISGRNITAQEYSVKDGIRVIADGAFVNCDELRHVTVPDGAERIGNSCFWGCERLESVSVPEKLEMIDSYAFLDCPNFKSLLYRGSERAYGAVQKGEDLWNEGSGVTVYYDACIRSALHVCDSYNLIVPTSCEEPGSEGAVCSVCNELVIRTIPALGHSYSQWETVSLPSCSAEGKQVRECSTCKNVDEDILPKLEHVFGEYTVKHAPTTEKKGIEEAQCTLCNSKKSRSIDKLSAGDSQDATEEATEHVQAATKAENIIVTVAIVTVAIAVAVGLAIVAIVVILVRKKKNKK